MVFDKPDVEFMVYTLIRTISEGHELFRRIFSPEYLLKHYRHIYIPRMDMPWDFNSAFGLERFSIFHIVRSFDSYFQLFGDLPPEKVKKASFENFYPPHYQSYSDWRKDFNNWPLPPMINGEILPRGKYPPRGVQHFQFKEYMTRYGRYVRETMHNATRLKPDPKAFPLGIAQERFEKNIEMWRSGQAALAGRYSWPAGTQVEFLAPLGTEYYIKAGLYKKGDVPTMPASRFKSK